MADTSDDRTSSGWRRWWHAAADRLPPRVRDLVLRLVERELLLESSSLAFYGLVSALPMLVVAFSVVSAVAGDGSLEAIAQQAEENGPAGAGQLMQQLIESSDTLSWGAIVFTLWPATAYGGGLRRALERATSDDEAAPALRGRLTAFLMVLALPVLVLAGLPMAAFLTSLADDGLAGTVLGWTIALVAGGATLTLVISLLYRAFTPTRLGWGQVVKGAALTAAITTIFSIGFVIYLRVGEVEERFGGGTIGLVVMLGVYLFVANTLLLAGFEAAAELDEERGADGAAARGKGTGVDGTDGGISPTGRG